MRSLTEGRRSAAESDRSPPCSRRDRVASSCAPFGGGRLEPSSDERMPLPDQVHSTPANLKASTHSVVSSSELAARISLWPFASFCLSKLRRKAYLRSRRVHAGPVSDSGAVACG
eukprot:2427388-Prymnesium_polylepis.1